MTETRSVPDLVHDRRGIALIEFALILPLFLLLIMGLIELCSYTLQKQRISQIALQLADNAGRLGASDFRGPQKLTEAQINDVLLGGSVAGEKIDLARKGRIILSSLELNASKGQWIHWQRCKGGLVHPSSFGNENDGENGNGFPGMGRSGTKIVAEPDHPVMFVEVAYQWRPITPLAIVPATVMIETASMPVRGERDLSELQNGAGVSIARC